MPLYTVASFAEAWIEIFFAAVVAVVLFVASFAEAWIEILKSDVLSRSIRRLLRGGVD